MEVLWSEVHCCQATGAEQPHLLLHSCIVTLGVIKPQKLAEGLHPQLVTPLQAHQERMHRFKTEIRGLEQELDDVILQVCSAVKLVKQQ